MLMGTFIDVREVIRALIYKCIGVGFWAACSDGRAMPDALSFGRAADTDSRAFSLVII